MHTNTKLVRLQDGTIVNVSQITERLFLGGIVYEENLLRRFIEENNIKAIVSVWDDDRLKVERFGIPASDYLYICIHDNQLADIMQHFEETYKFLHQKAHVEQKDVYVHCHAGVSRSASIIIYYCMRHYHISLAEAYRMVDERRRIRPNDSFVRQLEMAESSLEF